MSGVNEVVAELRALLKSCPKEQELLESIEDALQRLRAVYRCRKDDFTPEVLTFLKGMSPVADALREFVDVLQGMEDVRTCDDAEELAAQLHQVAEQLGDYTVRKRVEKEIRELVEQAKVLPSAETVRSDAELRRKILLLERQAQPCRRCNSSMVLRESQHGYFWGCAQFPQCFGKRWFTKEEGALLR